MAQLSRFLRSWHDPATGREGLTYACVHCGAHTICTKGAGAWGWNGDIEKPVFTPSVLLHREQTEHHPRYVCHSFVGCNGAQPGEVVYLSDCTHDLAGQVVPFPELPVYMRDGYAADDT